MLIRLVAKLGRDGFLTMPGGLAVENLHHVKSSPAGTKEPSTVPPGLDRFSAANPLPEVLGYSRTLGCQVAGSACSTGLNSGA